jgi:hypothetical protein
MATLDELAAQFGGTSAPASGGFQEAPTGVRTPWQGLPPAKADDARLRAGEQARRKLDALAGVVDQGAGVLADLERFGEYNRKSRTGAFYEGSFSSFMPESLRGADEQVMKSITTDLAPRKRIEGSGTTSDKDISLYLASLPGIDKPGSVNEQIRQGYRQQYERAKSKLNYLQNYYDQYGHLNGADVLWEKEKVNYLPSTSKGTKNSIYNAADAIIGGK